MIKLFGILDILAAFTAAFAFFGVTSPYLLILVFLILLKSVPFLPDSGSIGDIFASIFLVLAVFNITGFFTWIAVIWFAEKGLLSLLAE